MLKTKFQAVIAVALAALGLKELPKGEDGKLALDATQEEKLKGIYTGENYKAFVKVANEILAEEAGLIAAEEAEKENANNLLASVLKGNAGGEDDENKPNETPTASVAENAQQVAALVQTQQAQIQTLMNEPEPAPMTASARKAMLVGTALAMSLSTSTHLFGSNPQAQNKIFSFEGRNWNKKAAGLSAAKTDFEDISTITRLNEDLKEYHVQNPTFLRDLYQEFLDLPAHWVKRTGIIDRVSDAVWALGSVTQARKPDWTPNLEMMIEAETRRIYRIQIDKEWNGYQLQELETSWLSTIHNFDGSSPYKHSFIAFLVGEIFKKARQEDAEGAWNGIYAPNIKGITVAGHYLNAQSGLRHQLYMFRDVLKKITPYVSQVGKYSVANAQEYLKGFIKSLPLEIQNRKGMYLYLSPSNIVKAQDNYKDINKMNNDYTGQVLNYVEGFPNIQFYGDPRLEGSNLMFITDEKNIETLDYIEKEKEIFRLEMLKRDTFGHADYRFGAAFVFSGFQLPANSEFKGIAQFIWVNDEPIFPETRTVPLFGSPLSTPVEINYNRLHVHPELVSDVVKLTGMPEGTVVEITGNANMVSTKVLKKKTAGNGGNLDLTADFNPKTTYKLILAVQADGTYKELVRVTDFPSGVPSIVKFDDLAVDFTEGPTQKYDGAVAGTLTGILNGNEGAELTIYGKTGAALTVASVTGKIVMTSNAVLDGDAKFVKLRNLGGVWYETARG